MKVIKYTEAPAKHYSNAQVKGVEARVVIGKQDGAENFFMRVFDIAPAGNTPRHTHDWEHEMFCHAGEGEVFCGEQWHRISAGNVVFIPANAEHQIRNSGENNLSIVCLVPAKAPELLPALCISDQLKSLHKKGRLSFVRRDGLPSKCD